MKEYLQQFGIIDHLTVELNISQADFTHKLIGAVEEGSSTLGMFGAMRDVFGSGSQEYVGRVEPDGFAIRRRRRVMDVGSGLATATGTYTQNGESLVILTDINSFTPMFTPYYIILVIFYLIFFVSGIYIGSNIGPMLFFVVPFFLLHGALMFGIPIWMMRTATKKMKHDLEREFHFIANK